MAKLAQVRFYVDADILGLAKALASLRSDVTYPGMPGGDKVGGRLREACPIASTATKDTVWIPETAARGWLILTRDSAIQGNRPEVQAVRESGARMIAMSGKDAVRTWDQLALVMKRWNKIEALLEKDGPYIYTLSQSSFRSVPLTRRTRNRPALG